ncbi:MAG TPA: hypothetical protein VLG72_05480 [Nitrospirota bacterium]|nr:hypothetical protein [Nitrospirota bacterium]
MSSSIPTAPDSLTTSAAPNSQNALKRHWYDAAADCGFPHDKLSGLCNALNNRGDGNKSRLDYVLRAFGAFEDQHARMTGLTRLLLEYSTRRSGSAIANDKWVQARRGLLALREGLPPALRDANIFRKLESASELRPVRRTDDSEVSWRNR